MTNLLKKLRVHVFVLCGLLQLSVFSLEAAKSNVVKKGDKINCTLYFYSCENGINNFKPLKDEFDKYLATKGGILFQPFDKSTSFNNYVKGKKNCLLLLSSWHYTQIHKSFNLKPLMVGVVKGSKYQSKVLVVKDRSATLESISKSRITAAGSSESLCCVLPNIFKDEKAVANVKVLTVPKDLDALFSVGYDKSTAALCSKRSFELLQKSHPAMASKLSIIAEGQQSLNMILATTEGQTAEVKKAVKILVEMASDKVGKGKLKRLGLDGFKALSDEDLNSLENGECVH